MSARSLNLKHLRYFTEVARRGSVSAAARALCVAPQTVSAQVQELEGSIQRPLFERVGRRMVLTQAGQTALEYANGIFALGDELGAVLRGKARERHLSLRVGVTDSVPKLLTALALQPVVTAHAKELEIVCHEGRFTELLGQVASGEVDMVLTDAAAPSNMTRLLHTQVISESGISFLAHRNRAARLSRGFPKSLDDAPYIAGSSSSSLMSQAIEAWFARNDIRPKIVGRIDDSALVKAFAQQDLGFIAAPSSIQEHITDQYGLKPIGQSADVRYTLFLIRPQGRRPHALVAELEAAARGTRRNSHHK